MFSRSLSLFTLSHPWYTNTNNYCVEILNKRKRFADDVTTKKGNFDCDRLDVNKEVMPKFVNAIHSEMSFFF